MIDLFSKPKALHISSLNKYYLIDHKILFLFGYLFYLFTPYILGTIDAFHDYPGIQLYQQFFQQIPAEKLRSYLIITLSWLPAFYLGHFAFKLYKPYKRSLELYRPDFTSLAVPYLAVLLFIVLLLFIYVSRNFIFGSFDRRDVAQLGKLSTLIIVYDFFLLYQLISKQKVSFLLVVGTIITALMLLISGGRLTALQTFMVLLIYKTSFAPKRWKWFHLLAFVVIGFFFGSFIGIWRVGVDFNLDRAWFSLLAEPLFTWFSTSTFLISNDIPLVNLPINFITSFFNLIPNTLFNSSSLVVSASQMGFVYENPFGADSIWTTLVINFGSIGSFFFIFLTGFMLNFLRHLSENNRFWAVYYILVCAMIPFEFFRTGFFILNKQLFFNFLFMPGIVIFSFKIIAYLQSAKNIPARELRPTD